MPSERKTRPRMKALRCGVKYFCVGSFLIFMGSVLLCALGITVVLPYRITKNWVRVVCLSTGGRYNESLCSCEQEQVLQSCQENYPCLQVRVRYNRTVIRQTSNLTLADINSRSLSPRDAETTGNTVFSGMKNDGRNVDTRMNMRRSSDTPRNSPLKHQSDTGFDFEHEVMEQKAVLYRSWSDAFYQTCSLHECDDPQWNIKQSQVFLHEWGSTDHTFPCYYDPARLNTVVLHITGTANMVHAVLWPSLCLMSGIIIWLGLYCGCWVIDTEDSSLIPGRVDTQTL